MRTSVVLSSVFTMQWPERLSFFIESLGTWLLNTLARHHTHKVRNGHEWAWAVLVSPHFSSNVCTFRVKGTSIAWIIHVA